MTFYTKITLLVVSLITVTNLSASKTDTTNTEAQADTASSNIEDVIIRADDPVMAMMDSLLAAEYIDFIGFDETHAREYEEPDSVITFDSLTYAKRMEALNAKSPINLNYNKYVKAFINLYANKKRELTAKVLGIAPNYFPMFEEKLDKHGLPLELKYLAIVESALNPKARSWAGATGLWQFMYRTGKMYDLNVTSYYDDRSDPEKSTEAACKYMKALYGMYGDWGLVLAAYNSGPGNVNKAIRRSGGKRTYWEIRRWLPRETRGYVPAFNAVIYIMNYHEEHGIEPLKPNIACFKTDTVHVKHNLTFEEVSEFLDIPLEYLEFLNPMYKENIIPATSGKNVLSLPYDKIGDFITNEESIYSYKEKILAEKLKEDSIKEAKRREQMKEQRIVHHVRSGEFLGYIAEKYHCRVSQIMQWNNMHSTRLSPGQKLIIYSAGAKSASQAVAKKETKKAEPKNDGKYSYYTIQRGDTLWDIAKKYNGISVYDLKKINNNLNFKRLKPGMKIKVSAAG